MNIIKSTQQESPDLGQDIKEFQNSSISYSSTQGRHDALHNKPVTIEELNASIFNHIEIETEEQLHKNQQDYLPVAGIVVANKVQLEADKVCAEITGYINDFEHKIAELEQKKKELTPDLAQHKKRIISHVVVALVGMAEGYLIFEALRRSGFPFWAALITSIGLGTGIAFVTHVAAQFIKWSKTKWQLFLRICIVLVPAFILFILLGNLRAAAYNASAELISQTGGFSLSYSPNSSGWKIALVSFFLYCIGLAISVRYAKTKEEKEQEKAYDKVYLQYNELLGKINKLKTEIKIIKDETAKKVHSALATYEYALSREKQLLSIAKKALETYVNNNLRHRTDGQCPTFFSTLPAFSFQTFFDNVKVKNT